jgi:hypothetical protein
MSPTHIISDLSNETSPTSSHPSGAGSGAIRVAGPPSSTCPFSPISSIQPLDSASVAGKAKVNVDHADFVSAVSQSPSRTAPEADFLSVIARLNASAVLGDLGDDIGEAEHWAGVWR